MQINPKMCSHLKSTIQSNFLWMHIWPMPTTLQSFSPYKASKWSTRSNFAVKPVTHNLCVWSFLSHLTKTYYWRYRVIFRSFCVSICSAVIKISLIYITSIRSSSYFIKDQHLHQIAYFTQFESLNKQNLYANFLKVF